MIPPPQKITHSQPPASENHSQSSHCLRKSLILIPQHHKITDSHPLPQKITQHHSPALHTHSASCSCLRKSLTAIPLPQKITHSHSPASENHSQSCPCLTQSHSCDTHTGPPALALCLHFIYFIISFTHTHSWSCPRLTQLRVSGVFGFVWMHGFSSGVHEPQGPRQGPAQACNPRGRAEAGG